MKNREVKSYLITNIPDTDWKRFKRWSVITGHNTLNEALSKLIKLAGNNKFKSVIGDSIEHNT